MATRYRNVLAAFYSTAWAILPEKLLAIQEFIEFKADGGTIDAEAIEAITGGRRQSGAQTSGSVAVLPLFGVLSHRQNMLEETSGGTSTEMFGKQFDDLMANDRIGAVVLDVDSPGGSVQGVSELAGKIRAARGHKPIVAVANATAASAAYWVASQADRFVAIPSAEVGSIGVIGVHTDQSEFDAQVGVKHTILSAGKRKAEGNPFVPLDDESKDNMQARINDYYGMFVADVAAGRGVSAKEVRGGFGEGGVVGAKEAVKLGMIDAIGSLESEVARLAKPTRRRSMAAMGDRLRDLEARR